jgi:hypothetical protein
MALSKARSKTRRAVTNADGLSIRGAPENKFRTAVAITGSAILGYTPFPEPVDEPAHALPGMLGGVIGDPSLEIEI